MKVNQCVRARVRACVRRKIMLEAKLQDLKIVTITNENRIIEIIRTT